MVSDKDIRASNALINDATAPRVAVFLGGSSGIGQSTIRALVATGASMRIYLIGRKSSAERAEVIWTDGEVALLAETKRICELIRSRESRIDLLFLGTGYAPFGERTETNEGLEITPSLEYYQRMLFVVHLLPLLRKSEAPRVVSILGGGLEAANIDPDVVDLKMLENLGRGKARFHYTGIHMTTLEKMAIDNPTVTFIHSWPGWVNTGNGRRDPHPNSLISRASRLIVEPIMNLFSVSDEATGQRHLFVSTSSAFGGHGVPWKGKQAINSLEKQDNGLFVVNYTCDCTLNAKVLAALREKAQQAIWEHTKEVLKPYM